MNLTIGLPEITMASSSLLYLNNHTVMGHVFVGLSLFIAFGRLAMKFHFIEQEKKTLESNKRV